MKEIISFVLCIIAFCTIIICLQSTMFLLCRLTFAKSEHEYLDMKSYFLDKEKISELHQEINKNIKSLFITTIVSLLLSIIYIVLENMLIPMF